MHVTYFRALCDAKGNYYASWHNYYTSWHNDATVMAALLYYHICPH